MVTGASFHTPDEGPVLVQNPVWSDGGPPHGFTTRRRASPGAGEIDMVSHAGAAPARVKKSRRAIGALPLFRDRRVVRAEQVHGGRVADVTEVDGNDLLKAPPVITDGVDGLVARPGGPVLMAYSADCPIVFLSGRANGEAVAAVLHASWKGIHAGILEEGLDTIEHEAGLDPVRLSAFISPSIRVCCYEVQDDFRNAMLEQKPGTESCFETRDGRMYFDLQAAIRRLLIRRGLESARIIDAGLCSFCREDLFYSYRRDGIETGRMAGLIAPPGTAGA